MKSAKGKKRPGSKLSGTSKAAIYIFCFVAFAALLWAMGWAWMMMNVFTNRAVETLDAAKHKLEEQITNTSKVINIAKESLEAVRDRKIPQSAAESIRRDDSIRQEKAASTTPQQSTGAQQNTEKNKEAPTKKPSSSEDFSVFSSPSKEQENAKAAGESSKGGPAGGAKEAQVDAEKKKQAMKDRERELREAEARRKEKREIVSAAEKEALLKMQQRPPYKLKSPQVLFNVLISPEVKKSFTVQVFPEWAPRGAHRFSELVENGYYNNCYFFRVIAGFMVQWGISSDPAQNDKWRNKRILDDKVAKSNTRGLMSFATSGANARTTQVFINFGDNSRLDSQGFAPFGQVIDGMDTVDSIFSDYGERPHQNEIQEHGSEYIKRIFPKLSLIESARIIDEEAPK